MECETNTKPKITNKKYELLNESLKAITNKRINILILVGEAGMGKTFPTLAFLKENNINYKYINSYATPLSFYEILYQNSDRDIVIFDDISSIANPLIISLLKSACWSSDNCKIVSWYSTSQVLEQRRLPPSFEFNAGVVLIFNQQSKGYKSIINRGVKITFNFTFKEKLKIFEELQESVNIDDEILTYINENCNEATGNLSIRTLVILSTLKEGGFDFKMFASEMLPIDEEINLLRTLSYKEWTEETGRSMKTYYNYKKKYGLR